MHKELGIDPSHFNDLLNQETLILFVNILCLLSKRESMRITWRKYGNNDVADCNSLIGWIIHDVTVFVDVNQGLGEPHTLVSLLCDLDVSFLCSLDIFCLCSIDVYYLVCSSCILSYVLLMYFILCALHVFILYNDGVNCRMMIRKEYCLLDIYNMIDSLMLDKG